LLRLFPVQFTQGREFDTPWRVSNAVDMKSEPLPWQHPDLLGWTIVGMNHYREDNGRKLFIAMTRAGHCIKVEGPDDRELWDRLAVMARVRSAYA
jgi:hypothetical protein